MQGWVIVAVVAILGGIIGDVFKHRRKSSGNQNQQVQQELDDLRQQLKTIQAKHKNADLITRVECLETIVSDTDFEIKKVLRRLDTNPENGDS